MKIVILGAGNVATHLCKAFVGAGHEVVVWNRTQESLVPLREFAVCTTQMIMLPKDVDLYLISVKDDAVADVATQLHETIGETAAMVAHTAGSLRMDMLGNHFCNCGVFYPMQTFSKDKVLDYSKIPFFVEANGEGVSKLEMLARSVSDTVYHLNSEQRKHLHLASVFACNFANHLFAVSEEILNSIGLPLSVMQPLIDETIDKVYKVGPVLGQTGPAVREDHNIMDAQMQLLSSTPELQEIYKLISQNIINYKHKITHD